MYRQHTDTGYASRPIAKRAALIVQRGAWRASSVATYERTQRQALDVLPAALAARVRALTGRAIAPESIFVDQGADLATAVVDGAVLRMRNHQVVLLRPCAECGIGHFESPALATQSDLGYALSAWEPRCPHCQPEDPANWLDN